MTISFGDDIRAVVNMLWSGESIYQNVLYYVAGVGVSGPEATVIDAIGDHLLTAYNTLNAVVSLNLDGVEVEFYKRNTGTGKWDGIGSYDFTGWLPTGAGEFLPEGVAAVIRFFADAVGNQGRKFIAGLLEAGTTGGVWTSTVTTALVNYATELVSDVTTSGGDMQPGWWNLENLDVYEFNGSFAVNTVPGYQRRRKPGVGI